MIIFSTKQCNQIVILFTCITLLGVVVLEFRLFDIDGLVGDDARVLGCGASGLRVIRRILSLFFFFRGILLPLFIALACGYLDVPYRMFLILTLCRL